MKTCLLSLITGIGLCGAAFADGMQIQIELKIEKQIETSTKKGKLIFKQIKTETKKEGADFSIATKTGKTFKASSYSEFIAPTEYDPFEAPGDVKLTKREDGSVLVEYTTTGTQAVSTQRSTSFPVTPANPTAFEAWKVGWEVEGKARISDEGLVIFNAEIRSHDALAVVTHYGEGTGPIVTKAKGAFGKSVEVVLTENKAMGASTSVTKTPLILKARPGMTYPIQVMMGGKSVAATIRCSVTNR